MMVWFACNAKTGGHKGIRGDRRFRGRGGHPVETSHHLIHQNTRTFTGSVYFVRSHVK